MKKVLAFLLTLTMLLSFIPLTAFPIPAEEVSILATDAFAGKKVSILSHSMSTYAGVSNNTAANSTIGKNDVYYTAGRHGVYQKDTWWQQAIDALGMELLVNNSWSGSCIFQPRKGEVSVGYGDRAVNLHNDHTGEEPDIIWVYLGCNDFAYFKDTFGKAADVDYSALITDNSDGTFTYAAPKTACEAYAIMLHKVATRYPNAAIYCMTSTARRDPDYAPDNRPDAGQPTEYSAQLHQIAKKHGYPIVDLEKVIPKEAEIFDQYIGDKRAHANALGMDQITNELLSVMLGADAEIRHVTCADGTVNEQAVLLGGRYSAEVKQQDGYSVVVSMNGADITAESYRNGTITIENVTGDIVVRSIVRRTPLDFSWNIQSDVLTSVGDTENTATKLSGTITDGLLTNTRYQLETAVVLKHNLPWELEWQFTGDWRGCIFATDPLQKTKGMYYLTRTVGGQLCFGTWSGQQHDNYGVDLSDLDDQTHTYRLVNKVSADGSNMVWLYVDDAEMGAMNHYYVGSKDQAKTSDWISGKDFVFPYIGMDGHALKNCRLHYLSITECAHTYVNGTCTGCGEAHPNLSNYEGKVVSILGDSISTFAGYIPVADGFNLQHYARYPQDNLFTDVEHTWWMQVLTTLKAKLGVNESWRSTEVGNIYDVEVNSGYEGTKACMASTTRIQNLGSNGTPDVILFYGGTNDITQRRTVGSFDSATAPTDVDLMSIKWDTVADAYVAAIMRMRYYYPNAEIIAMLPTFTYKNTDAVVEEYNSVFATICEYYGVDYIDLRDCGITTADLPDGTHPNEKGMDYITAAVLDALMMNGNMEAGEHIVHSVTHNLTDTTSSKGYYKGVSHGKSFATTITGENLSVTVTMGGADITIQSYKNGVVSIAKVTGDVVITANGKEKTVYEDHLQQLPEAFCSGTNLWTALKPENRYYTTSGWGNLSTGQVWSITIPVVAGDCIYANSFDKNGSNGNNYSSTNGIRVAYFDAEGLYKSLAPAEVYAEFAANGCLAIPENVIAVCIPMWTNTNESVVYFLNRDHTYSNGVCMGCGAANPNGISLRYDDRYDVSGKTVEIVDAGIPTSYQVGYGVEENTVLDTAVVTLSGNTLIATGIGTATVKIDGVLYEVTVEAAPISLLLLIGQSNMQGSEGDENQSIVCPDGMVYSTYGDRYTMTTSNATNFAPSALTGAGSELNVNGTTTNLEDWPVYLLNERGVGKKGPDSGFAYEWVKQIGEKVWVVNAAHGGSAISTWQKSGANYKEAVALFSACQDTLQKEISAGHYTLSHMGYFWCQGCSDASQTAEWYVNKYLTMHENLKSALSFDEDTTFEFGGIVPILYGTNSYRAGIYADKNIKPYYESFELLTFNGPRVAQYWMTNNPDLPDIWNVCNIGEDWVWMPDGTNGVTEYFQSHYPNGTVDYTTQVQQSVSWYTPTTPAAVHDSIHYNQIGYNEVGREAARNALIMLGEIEAPEVETSVQFLSWDGYTEVTQINAATAVSSGTLVVPMVYPVWESKNVTYAVTEGMSYKYYDLLADSPLNGGMLYAVGFNEEVAVQGRELNSYSWELENGLLVSSGEVKNAISRVTGTTENNIFIDMQYRFDNPIVLLHDQNWVLEWKMTGPWYDSDSTTSQKLFCQDGASATPGSMCLMIKGNENRISIGYYGTNTHISYGLDLDDYGISIADTHVYRLENQIHDDGTNMIYLLVDGKQIGPMAQYFTGSGGYMGSQSDYLNGKDLSFGYLGTPKYLLDQGTVEYIMVVESNADSDIHFHDWSDWETVKAPDKNGPGEQNRTCRGCGEMETQIVTSIWQTTNILQHWNELPEAVCSDLNLWAIMEHDPKYYVNSKGDWDYHSSQDVPSVTFAVNPGDKIHATSFGAAKVNGHGSANGIRVTWFGIDGVIKTTDPGVTYAEFNKNGGYLIAPEGAVAINIPMWNNSDSNEIYILNRDHIYENGVCTGCGATSFVPGDADGDGAVNNRDLGLLQRYLNAWSVTVDTLAADLDADGKLTNRDLALLQRKINEWEATE